MTPTIVKTNLTFIENIPTEGVSQAPFAVDRLGRPAPKSLTALTRKRRLVQPGRLNRKDVTLGSATLCTSLKTVGL